uniref:MIF4G domain-containing protein n=1 Tax=Anopheles farauti TaxID=69004 RepID=A0A182QRF6_9DIPT
MEQQKSGSRTTMPASNHQQPSHPVSADQHQSAMFDEIRQEIGKIDAYAETIELTYHLRKFAELFRRLITTDQLINDLFVYLNEAALADDKFAIQLATVFASRQLGEVKINETKIRNAMIGMLQQNFLGIERLKQENAQRFYNSVTLLGEYYNRKKVAFGNRINILGQSLLLLLTSELELEISKCCQQRAGTTHRLDPEFAKLLLAQITLNGAVAKEEHRKEVNDLLYTIRKALIVIPGLCARAKSFLLMALDMYYGNLGEELLDKLYGKYLVEPTPVVVKQAKTESVTNGPHEAVEENNASSKQPKKASESEPKVKGAKSNVPPGRSTAGVGKSTAQNLTTNDKENKRRSIQTKPAQTKKPSSKDASATGAGAGAGAAAASAGVTGGRSIRVHEDGNIVATITRDSAPTSPTKKHPPTVAPNPSPRSPIKKGLSPRMEKLATLPKITITCSTPSPKRTQDKPPSALSPRAVLGPSMAKQKTAPPKSPIQNRHNSLEKRPVRGSAVKSVPPVVTETSHISPSHGESPASNGQPGIRDTQPPPKSPETYPTSPVALKSPTELDISCDWGIPILPLKKLSVKPTEPTNGSAPEPKVSNGHVENPAKPTAVKPPSYFREENVENLSWDALIPIDDESPQKVNPHTKSFLSFLANE